MQEFESLAAQARQESVPGVDVTARVLRRLGERTPETMPGIMALTLTSLGAAAGVTVWAIQVWMAWMDPLNEFFNALPGVLR